MADQPIEAKHVIVQNYTVTLTVESNLPVQNLPTENQVAGWFESAALDGQSGSDVKVEARVSIWEGARE